MKKIFLALFILISGFLFFPISKAQAQTPTPASPILQIPGYNCGDAESTDPSVQKCCLSSNLSIKDISVGSSDWWCVSDLFGSPVKAGCPANMINGIKNFVLSSWPIPNFITYLDGVPQMINPCINGNPSTSDHSDPNCTCLVELATTKILCDKYLTNSKDYGNCISCADKGVWTSIGCVNNNLNTFIGETVFGTGVGLAGGLSLLCIIYAAFMMQSSQGNPEKLKKSQEMITSCIMGLMLIIFSVFILRLIGVQILKIPGFG